MTTIEQLKASNPELAYLVEERAAIMEYDAGLPREEAERRALADVLGR